MLIFIGHLFFDRADIADGEMTEDGTLVLSMRTGSEFKIPGDAGKELWDLLRNTQSEFVWGNYPGALDEPDKD